MGTATYLYHDFLKPIAASYILGWVSSAILIVAGAIGFCFRNPYATRAKALNPNPATNDLPPAGAV